MTFSTLMYDAHLRFADKSKTISKDLFDKIMSRRCTIYDFVELLMYQHNYGLFKPVNRNLIDMMLECSIHNNTFDDEYIIEKFDISNTNTYVNILSLLYFDSLENNNYIKSTSIIWKHKNNVYAAYKNKYRRITDIIIDVSSMNRILSKMYQSLSMIHESRLIYNNFKLENFYIDENENVCISNFNNVVEIIDNEPFGCVYGNVPLAFVHPKIFEYDKVTPTTDLFSLLRIWCMYMQIYNNREIVPINIYNYYQSVEKEIVVELKFLENIKLKNLFKNLLSSSLPIMYNGRYLNIGKSISDELLN
jgi:serine/threonine protein kinase